MQLLRANTEVIVRIGPFVDVGDGFTPQTDITLGGDEAELLKAASVEVDIIWKYIWAATTGCRGWYDLTLTASNTDTEGTLVVVVQDDSDCLPVFAKFIVLAEAAWDSMFVAKDDGYMDVNIKALSEDTIAADNLELFTEVLENGIGLIDDGTFKAGAIIAAAIADAAIDNATFAADIGSTAYATNIIALAAKRAIDEYDPPTNAEMELRTLLAADYTIVSDLGVVQTGDSFAIVNGDHGLVSIQDDIDAILVDTGTTLDTLIKDIPIVAEFEARILVAADYTIVSDLGVVQTGDSFAIVNGDHGLVSIQDDVDDILADTDELQGDWANAGRLDAILDIIAEDTTTDIPSAITTAQGAVVVSAAGIDAIFDRASSLTLTFEDLITRIYQILNNPMTVDETTGAVSLKSISGLAEIATGDVDSAAGVTDRDGLTWA